jgi:phosphonate degradation associated HDIG domain protein
MVFGWSFDGLLIVLSARSTPALLLVIAKVEGYDHNIQPTGHVMSLSIPEIIDLLNGRAHTWYGQEAVSQLEHALQCAHLAELAEESPETIVAALLHDLGHMLGANSQRPKFAMQGEGDGKSQDPDQTPPTTDDLHQYIALPFLRGVFGDAVLKPIKLHVEAKRYLCATDPNYWEALSPASKHSLVLQGGVHTQEQVSAFEALPYADRAARLRRYDDLAKVPGAETPGLDHYEQLMRAVAL